MSDINLTFKCQVIFFPDFHHVFVHAVVSNWNAFPYLPKFLIKK